MVTFDTIAPQQMRSMTSFTIPFLAKNEPKRQRSLDKEINFEFARLPFLLDVVIDKLQERAKDNALPRHFQRTSVSLMTCARGEKEKRCSSFLPYQCRAPRKSRKRGEALKRLRKEKESANTEEGRQKRVEVRGRDSEYRAQLNFIHRLREC